MITVMVRLVPWPAMAVIATIMVITYRHHRRHRRNGADDLTVELCVRPRGESDSDL